MKSKYQLILMAVVIVLLNTTKIQAQEVPQPDLNVPEVVKAAFKTQYPNAKEVEWLKIRRNHEAEFVDNNMSISILFDKKGNIINKKTEISFTEYPELVKTRLLKDFIERGYKALSYMKRTEKEEVIYETLLVKGRDLIVVKYSISGVLVSNLNLTKLFPVENMPTN